MLALPTREVLTLDAVKWLIETKPQSYTSSVTSLPDISEFNLSLAEWENWFYETTKLVLNQSSPDGVSIFFQSDIIFDGSWIDKSYLIQKAAQDTGHRLLWHKIACRTCPDTPNFGRAAFSHILCFSKALKLPLKGGEADVLSSTGDKTWARGMGLSVALMIAKFIKNNTNSRLVINPFSGEGAVLAASNFIGLNALGIERSAKRTDQSRKLKISEDAKSWAEI